MSLNEPNLEKKLESLTNSQDSIQVLSLWILHHKNHTKRIIQIWMNCFQKAKSSHRLTLFYLANDVIQHAKRKGVVQYVDDFGPVIKEAANLVKGDKISSSIERVFNIWLERSIYTEEFIDELRAALSGTSVSLSAISKIVAEFKLPELIDKIKKLKKAEQNCASKLEVLVNCKVDATSSEVLNKLKDKTHGEQFSKDFDDATKCLETVISALEREVVLRTELVESLDKSEIFYETQKDEAKTVVDAYKNFELRVKNVGKRLEESKNSLPSPLPSPPRDAPSPTNSDDGPNLPQSDSDSMTDVNALLRAVADNSGPHQGSSLDQRLSNLIHSIPHMNDERKNNNSANYVTPHNSQAIQQTHVQPINSNPVINDNNNMSYANNNRWSTTDYSMMRNSNEPNMGSNYSNHFIYSPHKTNQSNNQVMYDYNYVHQTQDMNRPIAAIQPIQSLVSSRIEENKSQLNSIQTATNIPNPNIMPQFPEFHGQPSENFESVEMDLGNSDDEEIVNNRIQTQRTIKVIDTRRNSNEIILNNLIKVNNGNDDRGFPNNNSINNISNESNVPFMPFHPSPQIKSIARMPIRNMSANAHHPYPHTHPAIHHNRGPRSAVSSQYFPQNSPSMNAPSNPPQWNRRPPPNRNNRNHRNNRNNRF